MTATFSWIFVKSFWDSTDSFCTANFTEVTLCLISLNAYSRPCFAEVAILLAVALTVAFFNRVFAWVKRSLIRGNRALTTAAAAFAIICVIPEIF